MVAGACLLAALWKFGPTGGWTWARLQGDLAARREQAQKPWPPHVVRSAERVLLVSPHLDDETLGAGGLLARLARRRLPLRVVFLTNGDGSGSTVLALNFARLRRHSFVEAARVRQKEALVALSRLGIAPSQVVFLGYPDGSLQSLWDRFGLDEPVRSPFTGLSRVPYKNAPSPGAPFQGQALERDLSRVVRAFRPSLILSTHGADTHPDHWAANAFSHLAAFPSGAAVEGFLVHHGVFPLPHGFRPSERLSVPLAQVGQNTPWHEVALSPPEREAKRRALEEYRSQLVFTPHYLRAFVRVNEPLGSSRAAQRLGFSSWRDEEADSWGLAQRPGMDVREVSLNASPEGLQIVIQMREAPEARGVWSVGIKDVKARVVARRFALALQDGKPQVRELVTGRSLPASLAKLSGRTIMLTMPWSVFGEQRPRALVADVAVYDGRAANSSALDRTEPMSVRLDG